MHIVPDIPVLSQFSLMTGHPLCINIYDPKSHWWTRHADDHHLRVSINGDTQNWMVFFWEHPTKMDDLGVPLFQETSICGFVGDPQPWDSSNWRPPGWHGRGPLVGRGGPRCERRGKITIGEALAKWEWVKTLQSLRFSMYDMKDEQSSPAISMWKAEFPGYPHRLIYLIHGLVNGLISATNGRISHLAQTLRALLQGISKVSHSILGMASFDL